MISVSTLWGWAVASNERAVANARSAAVECSRLRVERAEVELFLADLREPTVTSTLQETAKAARSAR